MKLLIVADPATYEGGSTDVPETIARSASELEVHVAMPTDVVAAAGGLRIPVRRLPPDASETDFFSVRHAPAREEPWRSFDLVFDRSMKPFPDGFLEALTSASRQVPFVNDPSAIQKQFASARFLIERAKDYLPDAQVASGPADLASFLRRFGAGVLKRGNSSGGRGVFKVVDAGSYIRVEGLHREAKVFSTPAEAFAFAAHGDPELILMRYLPRVTEGDKRVVVVGGEIYGAYLRRCDSSWLQNVSAGARTTVAAVAELEREAVAHTSAAYAEAGIRTLGYDFLTDDDGTPRISEINAGNIGGIARLGRLGNADPMPRFIDWLRSLARASAPRSDRTGSLG